MKFSIIKTLFKGLRGAAVTAVATVVGQVQTGTSLENIDPNITALVAAVGGLIEATRNAFKCWKAFRKEASNATS